MNVEVIVNGRPWKIVLEPGQRAGTFTVTIKDKSREIDASWIDADTVSLIDDGGAAREIRLHPHGDNRAVAVEIGGTVYEALVSRRKRERETDATGAVGATGATGALRAAGPMRVNAPMPGRVVRVLVAVGDRVKARQAVVVVEAMKMENELRTPKDGVVKEVLVAAGATVESGAVLVVVEDQ
jgi:biotin carboxyl carrier protein